MKNLRINPAAKAVAVLLTIAIATGAFWTSLFTLFNWDDLWLGGNYYESNVAYRQLHASLQIVEELAHIYQMEQWNGSLSYLDQQRQVNLIEVLHAQNTNFRFQLHAQDGTRVYDNLTGGALADQVYEIQTSTYPITTPDISSNDYKIWDDTAKAYLELVVYLGDEAVYFSPENSADALHYGWKFIDEQWHYDDVLDSRYKTQEFVLECGIADPFVPTVQDEYASSRVEFDKFQKWLPEVASLALLLDALTLALLIFLCSAAGRSRSKKGYHLNWQDRIPFDLYLILQIGALALLFGGGDQIAWAFNQDSSRETMIGLGIISTSIAGCLVAGILTLATRFKGHTLLRNTILWKVLEATGRGMSALFHNWSMIWRASLMFCFYLLGTVLTGLTIFLIPVYQGFILWNILRWIKQWRSIRMGAAHIVGGDPDYRIGTAKLFPDLKEHAEQLNDLGSSIGNAVDERMRSERFKAELITNVSHDLKTPLTSIINYVDLLKKLEIENGKATEYIEVLDRKSQRLKKLTEDLVEASKASTGNLTVNKERLGVIQLVQQALAEYEDKFVQKHLDVISTLQPTELYVEADGRHLWRIIDNLLSNCYKYAMEGTRVYLDVTKWEGAVNLSVKNVSRQQLNIPADLLMERFIRGEEARSTEGSGLGLSIARSLTELQGGSFCLAIDGDLFKAVVSFPEASIPMPPQTLPP